MVKKQKIKIIAFLLPALLLIVFFYLSPSIMTVFYSFTDKTLVGGRSINWSFIGLDNYKFMFTDERFFKSLLNTVVFVLFSAVIGQQVLGFLIAYLMQKGHTRLRKVVGLAIILAWVTPEVVVAFVFYAFLNTSGTLNNLLAVFNIQPVAWLFDYAMVSVILSNVWRGTAFSMLMYQSALGNVSDSVKEAASIDGANKVQTLFKVILPIIKNSIATNTVLVTLQTIGLFGLIYAMTAGGPGYDTTTLPIYMYNQAFSSYQIGYGSAMGLILLLLGILLSVFYVKGFKQKL